MATNDRNYPFIREPEGGDGALEDVVIDVSSPGLPSVVEGVAILELDGGDIEVDFDGGDAPFKDPAQAGFHDNLAEYIPESELGRIARDVIDGVEADLESRKEWLARFQKGMELIGCVEPSANLGVLKHAKEINHPVIAEALIQYQARAIAEEFPPEGPVKAIVVGKKDPQREQQAERVSGYMNYQLLVDDPAYFHESDQGAFIQGLEGSVFKKVFRDHLAGKNVSRMVRARDLIVPYNATSLETAHRYTHILPYTQNEVRKLMRNGFYRQTDLDIPTGEPDDGRDAALAAQDKLEGKQPNTDIEEDRPHEVYEQHCELDLPGFEDVDEAGEPTGIRLPYIVHVDRDSQKVLAIYRNWREDDQLRRKRVRFAHRKFLPGPGFYGLGLIHVIGGLGAAATGILRILAVTSLFAGAGGGYKTSEVKIKGSMEIEPGVYKDTEHSYEELTKAFFTPEFKQPPEALFRVLGLLIDGAKSFSSTTEAMTGEGPATGPVGTMVALIEQGSKVFSGIHKRNHMSAGDEYRMLSELNGEFLPRESDGGYPYDVHGDSKMVFAEDFDARVDVIPVSDPNIFSSVQRVAVAQSILQLQKEYPDQISRAEAVRRMLMAIRAPDIESLMVDRSKVERADPISENAMLMVGRAVRAYPDQDHDAHMAVVMALLQDPQAPKEVKLAAQAHYAEHMALKFMVQAATAIGIPLQVNLAAEPGQPMAMQLPPQVERLVSQRAAAVINKLKPPPPSPEEAKVKGELELKQMKVQGELKINAMRVQAEARVAMLKAKLDAALARQVAFAKLALEREMNIRRIAQEGRQADADRERQSLDADRSRVDGDVQTASSELEEAIKKLAEGMDYVVALVEQNATGGAAATVEPGGEGGELSGQGGQGAQ